MLLDTEIKIRQITEKEKDFISGSLINENNHYKCIQDGEVFYVTFTNDYLGQIMEIRPSITNLDPDGGHDFMQKNVRKFIDSLVSKKIYVSPA